MDDISYLKPEHRFDSLNIHKTTFKKVGEHEIEVAVLVPKKIKPGPHPILVEWHGGGLVCGTALYPDWFNGYLIPLIHRAGAIAVLPNHRLLPESNGADIAADVDDLWKYVFEGGLTAFLKDADPGITIDLNKVCAAGGSAGGFLVLRSLFTLPVGKIKAAFCRYPMTRELRLDPVEEVFGVPTAKPEVIDEHLEAAKNAGLISSGAWPPERLGINFAIGAYGRWKEFFGRENEHIMPINNVEKAKTTVLPPTFIVHGTKDSAVSIEDTRAFMRKLKECLGEEEANKVVYQEVEGEDHGFDMVMREEEVEWLKKGIKYVEDAWLA